MRKTAVYVCRITLGLAVRGFCTQFVPLSSERLPKSRRVDTRIFSIKFVELRTLAIDKNTGLSISINIRICCCCFSSSSESDLEKAEVPNEYFASVFANEDITNTPDFKEGSKSNGISVTDIIITPAAVEKKLHELNQFKAQGPDLIPPKVLKELSKEIAVPLSKIFNKSLETGTIPYDWKSAEVTAIFKKGSKSEPGNYRLVSLTCIACKVLESIIRDVIVSHFTDNKLFAAC